MGAHKDPEEYRAGGGGGNHASLRTKDWYPVRLGKPDGPIGPVAIVVAIETRIVMERLVTKEEEGGEFEDVDSEPTECLLVGLSPVCYYVHRDEPQTLRRYTDSDVDQSRILVSYREGGGGVKMWTVSRQSVYW